MITICICVIRDVLQKNDKEKAHEKLKLQQDILTSSETLEMKNQEVQALNQRYCAH